ncbi:LysE family translocator [Roseateles koreensis]|uniref:LysE family translocator n=1 Tax=Roseateles koreensis TaxID=2987526 RepID=A0ABT5KPV4_9BURK|nr:LysE family translocator [Roseateles koreensis]MDC8784952.1 LysE family translocator [Roseateles koreensis]
MDVQTVLAVSSFATVTSITPGPNNMMLLASGVNHGLRATVPHILGISVGFFVLLVAAGLGAGALLAQWPQLHQGLKALGVGYMVWLAWKLWHAESSAVPAIPVSATVPVTGTLPQVASRPMSFWGAAAFQWVNPKAWMMALGAVAGFIGPHGGVWAVLVLGALCAAVNLPCVSLWAFGGAKLSGWLAQDSRRRRFNAVMALLLLASIWPMLNA